jgi:hypothetical protein
MLLVYSFRAGFSSSKAQSQSAPPLLLGLFWQTGQSRPDGSPFQNYNFFNSAKSPTMVANFEWTVPTKSPSSGLLQTGRSTALS